MLYYSYSILLILAYLFTLCMKLRLKPYYYSKWLSFYLVDERWKDNWIKIKSLLVNLILVRRLSNLTMINEYRIVYYCCDARDSCTASYVKCERTQVGRALIVSDTRLLTQLSLFTPNHRWHPPLEWSRHYNYLNFWAATPTTPKATYSTSIRCLVSKSVV